MIADQKITATSWLRQRSISVERVPTIAWLVIGSRLLVLASGVVGGTFDRIPGWQPLDPTRVSSSFGWLGNLLLGTSVRWDSIHFLSIAEHGYKPAADTQFFPAYPVLIHVVTWIVGSAVAAGVIISVGAFATALVLLHRLAREIFDARVADATLLLLAFAPLSLFFTAIYTESLNLALAVGTFYLARRGHFRSACVTAACATLTHIDGIALGPAVAYMLWEARGRRRDLRQLFSWDAVALLLPLAAFGGLALYMHELGFPWLAAINGANPTGHGYSIAPIPVPATHPVPGELARLVDGPAVTIWRAISAGFWGLDQTIHGAVLVAPGLGNLFTIPFQNLIYLGVLAIALSALAGAWRLLPKGYAIYATGAVLIYTVSVVTIIPLLSFDRYMLPVFPLWMVAARWLNERRLLRAVLILSSLCLVFYTLEFARWVMIA